MWTDRPLLVRLGAVAVLTAACGDPLRDAVTTEKHVSVSVGVPEGDSAVPVGDGSAVPTEVAVNDAAYPPPLRDRRRSSSSTVTER